MDTYEQKDSAEGIMPVDEEGGGVNRGKGRGVPEKYAV